MYFNISDPNGIVALYFCIKEVRTCILVLVTGIDDFYTFTIICDQVAFIVEFMFPDEVQKILFHGSG